MKLSSIYKGHRMWAVAYPTGHEINSEVEIELAEDYIFSSKTEAIEYKDSLDSSLFTELIVVEVTGLDKLVLS